MPIANDIDVDVAVRLAGVSMEEFQNLNPQMNKPVILAAGTPQVLLPYDNANAFVKAPPAGAHLFSKPALNAAAPSPDTWPALPVATTKAAKCSPSRLPNSRPLVSDLFQTPSALRRRGFCFV